MKNEIFENILLLFLLLLSSMALTILIDGLISDEMWYTVTAKNFDQKVAEKLIEKRTDFIWQTQLHLFKSTVLVIKVLLTAFIIKIGFYFSEIAVSELNILRVVIISWFIFLLPDLIKFCWFAFITTDYNAEDIFRISAYFPVDLIIKNLQAPYDKVLKPFMVFNPLEVFFCITASYFFSLSDMSFWKSLKVVVSSNFLVLFVVAVFRAFISSLTL